MIIYRIANTCYVHDLSGVGARLYGGRWNHKGTNLIYTSESRALATLEYLVHVPLSLVPSSLCVATIQVPHSIIPQEILISDLPANWRDFPAPIELAEMGTRWVLKKESLLLRVPSAVVAYESNILINPLHPDIKHAVISHVEAYRFDNRLFHKAAVA